MEEIEGLRERIQAVQTMELDLELRQAALAARERQITALESLLTEKLQAETEVVRAELKEEFGHAATEASYQAIAQAEQRARQTLLAVMQRKAATWTGENTTIMVKLPSDDVKGKLIGREGRNIKAFEQVTGTELIIDETPSMVMVSCFDPRRRLIAQLTLMNLVLDGRIHPARIEEIHQQSEKEFDKNLPDIGAEAAERAGVAGLNETVRAQLGALKFRGSLGQNVLEHSIEVSLMAAVLAAELGADSGVARRAGLLHDIGKVLGTEWGEAHALAGMEFLRSQGEGPNVLTAVGGHHYDIAPDTVEAQIVIVCDALSGSRHGARNPHDAVHLSKLSKLEGLAKEMQGVEKAFAYDSGREVRVFVQPDKIDELGAARLAKQVARKVKAAAEYPGPVKVTVIRETRAIEICE
ncbi:MAG: HD domain-containing protein [Armatimonadota bacterium]